jgi:hypothetical protein
VGEAGRAGVQRGDAIVVAAGAVADLHADASVAQRADQRQVAGHLGRQRQHLDRRDRISCCTSASVAGMAWAGCAPSRPGLM